MEINTTYQPFYQLLVLEVTGLFSLKMRPIDDEALAEFDITYKIAQERAKRQLFLHEGWITELYKTLNKVLIEKMFSSCPFNLNLSEDPTNETLKCTKEKFLAFTQDHANCLSKNPSIWFSSLLLTLTSHLIKKNKKSEW